MKVSTSKPGFDKDAERRRPLDLSIIHKFGSMGRFFLLGAGEQLA
jgi:hypothetical protein